MNLRKIIVFYLIAPVYALIFKRQAKKYAAIIKKANKSIDFTQYESVADLGCGNGALCYAFQQFGLRASGVDGLASMTAMAKHNLKDTDVSIVQANILELPFEDKSFDIAISSYVVHGMNREERQRLYREMFRIARHAVIFHDYNQTRNIFTNIVEWIEGGDYFDFIKSAEHEMRQYFPNLNVLQVDKRAAWYINTLQA